MCALRTPDLLSIACYEFGFTRIAIQHYIIPIKSVDGRNPFPSGQKSTSRNADNNYL